LTSQAAPQLAARWRWLLALLLLALLVWWVGRRLDSGPHAEIGVTGDQELPRVIAPSATPVADEIVERPPAPRVQPSAAAERGEPSPGDPARASPSPR
jgi:hypothetical protein